PRSTTGNRASPAGSTGQASSVAEAGPRLDSGRQRNGPIVPWFQAVDFLDPAAGADYKPRSRKRFTTMSFKVGLLARKLGMTQVFHEDGTALGCTVLQVGPCIVTAQRTPDKHGYAAVQLGFEARPIRMLGRPEAGQMKKAGLEMAPRFLREV